MTITTKPVLVRIFDGGGQPCPDGTVVTAKLDKLDREAGTGIVAPSEVRATTVSGVATLNCFPNHPETGLGTTGSVWKFSANPVGMRAVKVYAQTPNSSTTLDAIGDFEQVEGLSDAEAALAGAQAAAGNAASDAVQTAADRVATAADRVQTGLDRVATAADRVQTGLDRATTTQKAAEAAVAAAFKLQTWALTQAFRLVAATRNSDGAITTATIEWPDGTAGVYTADTLSSAFPGATDAWHATYASTPAKTITQPAVTRDASTGAVTVQPAITIV